MELGILEMGFRSAVASAGNSSRAAGADAPAGAEDEAGVLGAGVGDFDAATDGAATCGEAESVATGAIDKMAVLGGTGC